MMGQRYVHLRLCFFLVKRFFSCDFAQLFICRWVLVHTKSRCLTPPSCKCVYMCMCQLADGKMWVCMCLCGLWCMCVCFQVQQHWVTYTEKMDQMVEEALRLNIKCSLQALSKAINGDNKTSPNPLFRVQVVLRQDTPGSTVQVPKTYRHESLLNIKIKLQLNIEITLKRKTKIKYCTLLNSKRLHWQGKW